MSVRSATGHYLFETVAPVSTTHWTMYGIATIKGDPVLPFQILAAVSFNTPGGNDSIGFFYNDGDDSASVLSFVGGVLLDFGDLASRPVIGDRFAWFMQSDGVTATIGWYDLETPTAWVTGSCDALSGAQAVTWATIQLSDPATPVDASADCCRMTDLLLTPAQILADLQTSESPLMSVLGTVFDFLMPSTAGITEQSGSGATAAVMPGAVLSNDSIYSFPGDGATGGFIYQHKWSSKIMSSIANARVVVAATDVADVQLLPVNAQRQGGTIINESSGDMFVGLGDETVSDANHTVILVPDAYYEIPYGWVGEIRAIWEAASAGNAVISELE